MSLLLGSSCRASNRRNGSVSREECFPSAATLWGARFLGCGKALSSRELIQASPGHTRSAGGPLSSCCCCLHGVFWEKKGFCDFCTRTSSVSSVVLATPLQSYLNRNQNTLDSEGFSFHLALKEEESDFAKHP